MKISENLFAGDGPVYLNSIKIDVECGNYNWTGRATVTHATVKLIAQTEDQIVEWINGGRQQAATPEAGAMRKVLAENRALKKTVATLEKKNKKLATEIKRLLPFVDGSRLIMDRSKAFPRERDRFALLEVE